MLKNLIPCFICLLLTLSTGASLYASRNKPEYDASKIPKDLFTNSDAVIRINNIEFEVFNKKKAVYKRTLAITILNRQGTRMGEIEVYYDKFSQVRLFKGKIYDKNGNFVRDSRKKEEFDFSYNFYTSIIDDSRFKELGISHSDYPYTVEFEIIIEYNGLLNYPSCFGLWEENVSLEKCNYKIITPKSFKIHYTTQNLENIAYVVKNEGNKYIHWWHIGQIPAYKDETNTPPFRDIIPAIFTSPEEFEIDGYTGSMNSWNNLGQFYLTLNEGRDSLSLQSQAEIKQLVNIDDDTREKIKILYRYLQETTRYVSIQLGIGGWQSLEAEFVHEHKYGDCKALTNYMKALLRSIGIESYPVLVRAGQHSGTILDDFVSNQFNHVILFVPLEKDTVWLECTSQIIPYGYLGSFTSNKKGLLIDPDSCSLINTPTPLPTDNCKISKAIIYLDNGGNVTVFGSDTYSGYEYFMPAHVYFEDDENRIQEWFHDSHEIPSFNLEVLEFLKPDPDLDKIFVNYELKANRLIPTTGSYVFLKPCFLNKTKKISQRDRKRQFRVFNNKSDMQVDSLVFILPSDYVLNHNDSFPVSINSEFGSFDANCRFNDTHDTLVYTRQLILNEFDLPSDSYSKLVDFFNNIVKAEQRQIVFSKKE